jgi:transposase
MELEGTRPITVLSARRTPSGSHFRRAFDMSKTNSVKIIIGVDTHKDVHAAVAINGIGARLGTLTIPVSPKGYRNLETWARAFGAIHAFGLEGPDRMERVCRVFCRRRGIVLSK